MTRGGRTKDRDKDAERKCIATAEILPKSALIRFVVGPDGEVIADLAGKLPGRGMWVKADRAALRRAVDKNLFPRAAKAPVKTPEDLLAQVETRLRDRVISTLALARKAGQAICGYEKVRGSLEIGEARVLMQASDGSERGKTKLRAPDGPGSYIGWMTARELGLAFGRDSVIHGALTAGGLTMRVVEEATRLAGVRENDDGGSAAGKETTSA